MNPTIEEGWVEFRNLAHTGLFRGWIGATLLLSVIAIELNSP